MDIVLSALRLDGPGGMQTYLLTVAPHLVRLGHDVTLYAPELGLMSDLARERGLTVVDELALLPGHCDAIIAQDAVTLLELEDHYPRAARLLVVHSAEVDLHLPPGAGELVGCAVVLNDAVGRRVRSSGWSGPVVRLRQPIDRDRYRATGLARDRPRRVLLLGNYLGGRDKQHLEEACRDAGLSVVQVGLHGRLLTDPVGALEAADIVIGQGRSALDAMSCGRAVWVYGPGAGDGWVTEESYPAIERDGFRGRATERVLTPASFVSEVERYAPSMGAVNRRLVSLHHSAHEHTVALVEQVQRLPVPAPPSSTGLGDLARTIRLANEAQGQIEVLFHELRAAVVEHESATQRLAAERVTVQQLREELAAAACQRDTARRALELMTNSRRWRLTSALLRPLDRRRGAVR